MSPDVASEYFSNHQCLTGVGLWGDSRAELSCSESLTRAWGVLCMWVGEGHHEEGFLEEKSGSWSQSEEQVDRQMGRPWPGIGLVWQDHRAPKQDCRKQSQSGPGAPRWGGK